MWIIIPVMAAAIFALWFSPIGEKIGLWRRPRLDSAIGLTTVVGSVITRPMAHQFEPTPGVGSSQRPPTRQARKDLGQLAQNNHSVWHRRHCRLMQHGAISSPL